MHDDGLGMRFGGGHPTDARRHRLAVALCREAGLLDAPGVAREDAPGPLSDEALERVFAPAFIRAVRRYSDAPLLAAEPEARQWGIGGDNNAYPGMHDDSARACAACAAAAEAVAAGRARAALVPAGGAHHGTASQAQGFGMYNETAVAVRALLDAGLERVAYVNLDVHHGNGTQWIFYDEPRVLTVSVHESGRHLFPGSGFPAETGGAGAPGSAANVALPPFAGDDAYRAAWDRVVAPVVRAFRPDAIVAQCGVRPPPRRPAQPHAHHDAPLPRAVGAPARAGRRGVRRAPRGPRRRRLRALHRTAARVGRAGGGAGRRAGAGPGAGGLAPHRRRGGLPRAAPRLVGRPGPGARPGPRRPRRRRGRGGDRPERRRAVALLGPQPHATSIAVTSARQ